MHMRRLFSFASPVLLLCLGAAPGRAEIGSSNPVDVTGASLAPSTLLAAPVRESSSGLVFFLGVAVIAGALEYRRRALTR